MKISSGIRGLDSLSDNLYIGDNVVWEVDAGTSSDIFTENFIRQAFEDNQKIIYVSFNRSPHSVLNGIKGFISAEHFILIDCFTSGKGKNDLTFVKFYETPTDIEIIRIEDPKSIKNFTKTLNSIEDTLPPSARYVFDSLTGMQDLWGDENETYRFFTYMCPRLYDLGTVAYWILEKEAHSSKFKANLRHITQIVFDLYKRRDRLYIKALKLDGRQNREAFKPHPYEILGKSVIIAPLVKEPVSDIGGRLKEARMRLGISQKDLADRVNLTPSFISQLESNQISPSLASFMHICGSLGINPGQFLEGRKPEKSPWLFKRESIFSQISASEDGVAIYSIVSGEKLSVKLAVFPSKSKIEKHFSYKKTDEYIYVLDGNITVSVEGRTETLSAGDSLYLKESYPSGWRNEGGDKAELLLIC